MSFDDPLLYVLIVVGVIAACVVVFYLIAKGQKKSKKTVEAEKPHSDLNGIPFKIGKSVSSNEAGQAKEQLRILDLEREILSDAIRRLYEAHAEGKITEAEREKLALTYKSRMMTVKDAISKDESVVALHELETMQEDLVKLFSERFDEISGKIDELRVKAEAMPVKEVALPAAKTELETDQEEKPESEEKAKKKRKPSPPKPSPRTEAEKRIEEIRSEVEKVLDRLGQMEIES